MEIDQEYSQMVQEQEAKSEWKEQLVAKEFSGLQNKYIAVIECIYMLKERQKQLKRNIRQFEEVHKLESTKLPTLRDAPRLVIAI